MIDFKIYTDKCSHTKRYIKYQNYKYFVETDIITREIIIYLQIRVIYTYCAIILCLIVGRDVVIVIVSMRAVIHYDEDQK